MNCIRCHRPLKDPESIRLGIGPVCRGKNAVQLTQTRVTDHVDLPFDPETMDIVFERRADGIHVNIEQLVTYHSPDGFEWGYAGSGPADFALNILEYFIRRMPDPLFITIGPRCERVTELAWHLHQNFKFAFLAGADRAGGRIAGSAIREWIAAETKKNDLVLAP